MLNKSQSKKLISKLFDELPNLLNCFKEMSDDLLEMNIASEKLHRKNHCPSNYNFPIRDTAKYFVVRHLFDAMKGINGEGDLYIVSDLLEMRLEVLKAQAYAMKNTDELQEWFKTVKQSEFSTLYYCYLIS